MIKILNRKIGIGFLLVSICLMLLPTCSEKIIYDDSGDNMAMAISTKLSSGMESSALALFLLTITGPDIIRPIIDTMVIENHYLIARVEVPAGKNRLFKIEAFDDAGNLIYVGTTQADVIRDVKLDLDIVLKPYVPLIKVSPQFKSIHFNSQIVLELRVYNIPNLNDLEFILEYDNPTVYSFYIDSIVPNTSANDYIILETLSVDTLEDNQIALRIYDTGSSDNLGIVNDDGYSRLANIYVTAYSTEDMYDTVTVSVEATSLSNTAGNVIMPEIYHEGCTIEYFDPYYFEVAYWSMDSYEGDEIYDWWRYNLTAISHGTSISEGVYGNVRIFDDSDYIEVPNIKVLDINSEISIDMWIQLNFTEGDGTILSKMGEDGATNYQIRCISNNSASEAILSFEFGDNSINVYQSKANLIDNQWHRIILSCAFGDPKSIYWMVDEEVLNGSWVSGDGSTIPSLNSGNFQIGRQILPKPHYFHGGMDEIMIYSKFMDPSFFLRELAR